jgi:FkbM family methyltransferase
VRNIELNGLSNVNSYQVALSDLPGHIQIYSSLDGYDAWNSIAPPYTDSAFGTEMVTAITWDNFVYEHNLIGHVTLMKIDVEGWESKVLCGGLETFKRQDAPVLHIEFNDRASQAAGSSCRALYRQLEEMGYNMYFYDASAKQIVPYPIQENFFSINLLAIKNIDEAKLRIRNT